MILRRKVFSILKNENGEEKLFSTTEFDAVLTEEGEKMFAFKDYEGLSEAQKEVLKSRRSEYAKELLKAHRDVQSQIDSNAAKIGNNLSRHRTKGYLTAGGVKSTYNVETVRGSADSAEQATKLHKKSVTTQQLKNSKQAAGIMRSEVENMSNLEAHAAANRINPNFGKNLKEKIEGKSSNLFKDNGAKIVKSGGILGKKGKIALGVGAGITAAGAGAYLYKKHKDKKA